MKLTCPLLCFTHFPWLCIPGALLSDVSKEFFTLSVLKLNHVQSHAEVANGLGGAQLYFSCVEKFPADAVLLKQWDLWQGGDAMWDIPAAQFAVYWKKFCLVGKGFVGNIKTLFTSHKTLI